jgi:hypothetical protein
MRILVLEGSFFWAEPAKYGLERAGHAVLVSNFFPDADAIESSVDDFQPDLVVVGTPWPFTDEHGFQILLPVWRNHPELPFLFVSTEGLPRLREAEWRHADPKSPIPSFAFIQNDEASKLPGDIDRFLRRWRDRPPAPNA